MWERALKTWYQDSLFDRRFLAKLFVEFLFKKRNVKLRIKLSETEFLRAVRLFWDAWTCSNIFKCLSICVMTIPRKTLFTTASYAWYLFSKTVWYRWNLVTISTFFDTFSLNIAETRLSKLSWYYPQMFITIITRWCIYFLTVRKTVHVFQ